MAENEKPDGFVPLSQRPDLQIQVNNEDTPTVVDPFSTTQRPKLKFQFTVTFKFRNPIQLPSTIKSGDGELSDQLTFAVKQASRPNPTVVYQDINNYNFRTKVATKVDYGTMQLTMYDDVQNYAHDLYEVYLKSISPIANVNKDQASLLDTENKGPRNAPFNTEDVIDGSNQRLDSGTGSIGPLPMGEGGQLGLIENICIRHWYFSAVERRLDASAEDVPEIQYVEYQFLNPKVINMTLDELDMAQSDVSTVMMNFVYDSVFIDSPRGVDAPVQIEQPEPNTFTLNDIRGRIADIERLVRRVRRLDTIPDIPVFNTIDTFIPPITGNLPRIPLPKPDIDLPDILDF